MEPFGPIQKQPLKGSGTGANLLVGVLLPAGQGCCGWLWLGARWGWFLREI